MEKVSVIIPVYNSEKYLEECLNSIIDQTYSNIEIIVVDNGSTDCSLEICNKFKQRDCRIKVVQEIKKGVSNARNRGIDEATGEYIIFVDSDDWIEKELIEKTLNYYTKFNEVDVVMYNSIKINEENIKMVRKTTRIDKLYDNNDIIIDLIKNEEINAPWNKLYKKSIMDSNNIRFETNIDIGEDLLFNIQYFKNVKLLYYIRENLYNYRDINPNSLTKKYKENKYEQLMFVNKKLTESLNEFKVKSRKKQDVCKYIKLKNIYSCIKDLEHIDCKYSNEQKKKYIRKIKKNNKVIIICSLGFKIFIISMIYSISPSTLLQNIFKIKK